MIFSNLDTDGGAVSLRQLSYLFSLFLWHIHKVGRFKTLSTAIIEYSITRIAISGQARTE